MGETFAVEFFNSKRPIEKKKKKNTSLVERRNWNFINFLDLRISRFSEMFNLISCDSIFRMTNIETKLQRRNLKFSEILIKISRKYKYSSTAKLKTLD